MKRFRLTNLLLIIIPLNFVIADNWNLPWVTIITRSEWWADETIRLKKSNTIILETASSTTTNKSQTTQQKNTINYSQIRNAWMAKNYPNEWKYEWSNKMLWNGYLTYPEYFNHHKNKIVIHHTAMDYDPNRTIDEIKSHIQKIYKYHAINRSFGDIWYNFLIDQLWNIYEWRSGWEWAVWMHASSNNVSSIWIALLWNFENDTPTAAQLSSLINLTAALARYYNIDPLGKTHTFELNTTKEPYVTPKVNYNIMWHEDVKATACPGKNLYKFIPMLRDEVDFRLKNWIVGDTPLPSTWIKELPGSSTPQQTNNSIKTPTTTTNSTNPKNNEKTSDIDFPARIKTLIDKDPKIFNKAAELVKKQYKWTINNASNYINKITKKYTIDDIKVLLSKNISVLLYELTTKYDSFEIKCENECIFTIDGMNYSWANATLTFLSNKIQVASDRNLSANSISVKPYKSDGIIEISNYQRKSYAWIPWNIFKWELSFEKWTYPLKNGEQKSGFIVINTLPFTEYMKWIVETNDTETLEKNKVMAMIAKNYALFYLNKENIHPNITKEANYSAIDDPDFFQKYVWAWLEQTLTKWYKALDETKDQIVIYDGYLPVLPYFNCSPGFTLSAQEKRWWIDTPYLKSVYDFNGCSDFVWHWVWLAGKWAEFLAKKWMIYNQILKYYYDGVEIVNIN